MSEPPQLSTPQIAGPVVIPSQIPTPALAAAGLICAALAVGVWFIPTRNPAPVRAPVNYSELDAGLVTSVRADDAAAVATALDALRLPQAQKLQVEQDVRAGRRRLGWIIFIDSMDPDGDQVAVEAGGLVQHVILNKAWTPVAVPLTGTPIGVTAVRDGGGGGVTVALGTSRGPVTLRILIPGERIEVAAP